MHDRVDGCEPAAPLNLRDRRELVEIQRQAQWQKLEALSALAGGIAHDFNNLVTGILGHVSLCRLSGALDQQALGELAGIEAITLRAAQACRRLATLAGKGLAHTGPHDLNAIVRQAGEQAERGLPGCIRLRITVADNLPAVAGEAEMLRQMMANLLANAFEALYPDGGEVVIRTQAPAGPANDSRGEPELPCFDCTPPDLPAAGVCLEVCDNGPGLAPAVQARLFEPFFSTRQGNRGLGLATVLGVVRSHRGGIQVHSVPGQGTLVRVYLPLWKADPKEQVAQDLPSSSASPTPTAKTRRPQGTILLVDDERSILDVASRLLTSLGFDVLSARDGERALELFAENRQAIRLALVDLSMPRMSGEEIVREMCALSADVPLVLMSGYPESDVRERLGEVQLSGYLQKPFRLPALLDLLGRLNLVD